MVRWTSPYIHAKLDYEWWKSKAIYIKRQKQKSNTYKMKLIATHLIRSQQKFSLSSLWLTIAKAQFGNLPLQLFWREYDGKIECNFFEPPKLTKCNHSFLTTTFWLSLTLFIIKSFINIVPTYFTLINHLLTCIHCVHQSQNITLV